MPERIDSYDILIVGAGFSGMYALIKARELGLSALVLEAGSELGGTWFWNRYPGARCDVESVEYCYQFSEELQQDWEWSERFATQPEILRYINHVAERFDLRHNIQFNSRVTAACYVEADNLWELKTEDEKSFRGKFFIAASGPLSVPLKPTFPEQDAFQGEVLHTGTWPQQPVDFSGQRVAVIGTGASAVQCIPLIADQCSEMTVYQRTPSYVVPARNRAMTQEEVGLVKSDYKALRDKAATMQFALGARYDPEPGSFSEADFEQQQLQFEKWWQVGGLHFLYAFADIMLDPTANKAAAEFLRNKVRQIVDDPELAEKLVSHGVLGSRRLCTGSNYYETFNRDNVHLVDINESPILRFTPVGIETSEAELVHDIIVCATGFDAMTGALTSMDIRGRHDLSLRDKWKDGADTYLGMQVAGFPNLFLAASGVGTPAAFSNVLVSIEHQVDWIYGCIAALTTTGKQTIEPDPAAEEWWVEHVQAVADMTLFPVDSSFYNGGNVPGKHRMFLPFAGGFPAYSDKCQQVATEEYTGFLIT